MDDSIDTTILVVSYEQAAWIEQCLDSCLAQTKTAKIIVVDDASPDRTADVVRNWIANHATDAELIAHKVNVGLGRSLVEGLAHVDTEFFAYIAGDDWMEPERVEKQVAVFRNDGPECVLVYSDCYRADDKGNRIDALFSEGLNDGWKPHVRHAFYDLLDENWIPAPTVMIRTESLRDVGGYDPEIFYEDHDSYLRLARAGQFRCLSTPLATHRELTSSLGHRMFFYAETAPLWTRAKVLIYRKHLGFSSSKNADVAQRICVWAIRLYKLEVSSPNETSRWLGEAIPYLPAGRIKFHVFRWLALLHFPGRWLNR